MTGHLDHKHLADNIVIIIIIVIRIIVLVVVLVVVIIAVQFHGSNLWVQSKTIRACAL